MLLQDIEAVTGDGFGLLFGLGGLLGQLLGIQLAAVLRVHFNGAN